MATVTKTVTRIVVVAVVAAIVVVGGYFAFFVGSTDKTVTGHFDQAVGVYPGTPVKILGVNVGEVSSVKPAGGTVTVKMAYDGKYKLPKDVYGILVANSLVSDRYVQLEPAYTKGPVLASGGTIITGHTQAPAELDDIYASLNTLSKALGPSGVNKGGAKSGALSNLINVAAANLNGNGTALGNSITKLSQAAQTLSGSRGDLFKTVANLRTFTGALSASDKQVRLFNTQLAQVASDLASERADLGRALHDLGLALDDVNSFVKNNAGKFHTAIGGLKQITNVLVKQKSSLNEALAVAPVALANIVHAYQPNIGVIATRGNLASLTDFQPANVCALIISIAENNPVLGSSLGSIIGNPSDKPGANSCTGLLKGLLKAGQQLPDLIKKLLGGVSIGSLGGLLSGGLGGLIATTRSGGS